MRASELIAQLQEIMADHHCDPDIEVQTDVEYWRNENIADIKTEEALIAVYITRCAGFFPVIVIRSTQKIKG